MVGIIVITTALIEELKQFAEWAARQENWYDIEARMDGKIKPPGEDERYEKIVGVVNPMRCIFSWTIVKSTKNLYRHLSISVPDPDRFPNPEMAFEVAKYLGFTGRHSDWYIHADNGGPGEHKNVIIIQDLSSKLEVTNESERQEENGSVVD